MTRRRPILLALLALAVLAGLWLARARPPGRPAPEPGRHGIVFLGDSITSGHGLPLEETFPHRLGATLRVEVRNAGISGDRTAGGVARLEADVLAYRPALVVVELGVNDVFAGVPRETTRANLRTIIRRLRAAGAAVVLVHLGLESVGGQDREGFRTIAREEGCRLVEDFLIGVVPVHSTDGLHPDSEGHAHLAARLEPVLRELLADRSAT